MPSMSMFSQNLSLIVQLGELRNETPLKRTLLQRQSCNISGRPPEYGW